MLHLSFTPFAIVALIPAVSFLPVRGNALARHSAHDAVSTNSVQLMPKPRKLDPLSDARPRTETGAILRKRTNQQTVHLPNVATGARILHRTKSLPDHLSHQGEHIQAEELRRVDRARKKASFQTLSRVCHLIHQNDKMKYHRYCRESALTAIEFSRREHEMDKETKGPKPNMDQFNDEQIKLILQRNALSDKARITDAESRAFKEGFNQLWDSKTKDFYRKRLPSEYRGRSGRWLASALPFMKPGDSCCI